MKTTVNMNQGVESSNLSGCVEDRAGIAWGQTTMTFAEHLTEIALYRGTDCAVLTTALKDITASEDQEILARAFGIIMRRNSTPRLKNRRPLSTAAAETRAERAERVRELRPNREQHRERGIKHLRDDIQYFTKIARTRGGADTPRGADVLTHMDILLTHELERLRELFGDEVLIGFDTTERRCHKRK
ncbi:MAG: hypothetical protein JWN94_2624 [Betaproteobacteria bacterium]|nr:hypothetical protein [Betaproteobacteria bacterium]